jgi:hypothetical protein
MIIVGKNMRVRRWAAGLLLVAYGSVGVLGYGLHAVWECDHHCHLHTQTDGVVHVHHHEHTHGCHHHHDHRPQIAQQEGKHNSAVNQAVDDCPICEFLVQAQTPFVMDLTTDCVGPTLSNLNRLDASYIAPMRSTHPARGPPLC